MNSATFPTAVLATLLSLAAACGDPYVVSGFGSPMGAGGGYRQKRHAGVDFKGDIGDVVLASAPGFVVTTGYSVRVGYRVLVFHSEDGGFTSYLHLSEVIVRPGEPVQRGQVLGRIGLFPFSGGRSHVHLELCRDDCLRGHPDGDLAGLEDPMKILVGCYDPAKTYETARLVLTYPIRCE